MLPPAGDPPARNGRIIAVQATSGTLMSLASVTVLVRCYVRIWLKRAFGWDDWTMLAAAFSILPGILYPPGSYLNWQYALWHRLQIRATHCASEYDRDEGTLTVSRPGDDEELIRAQYWWIAELGYCFASVFCKISVSIFLLRIIIQRIHRWILYIIMGLTTVSGLIFMLTMMLQCEPVKYFWMQAAAAVDPSIEGHCNIDRVVIMTYVYSGFAALLDLTVGIVPIFIVKNLQMKRSAKIAIAGILGLACIASCGALARTAFVETFRDPEFLYATVWIGVWSNVETGVGITAGGLATLRPLTARWFGSSHPDRYYSMELDAQGLSPRPAAPRRRRADESLLFSTMNGTTFDKGRGKTITEVTRYETENTSVASGGSQEELRRHAASGSVSDPRVMEIRVQQTVDVNRGK